jgi:hypothetical protein
VRKGVAALAVLFLAAHLPFLPPTLEDLDSINFAMGVRDFDVARHQPHPPGYPVYIALGKASTAALRLAGVPAPEARGLSVWSALSGAALVLLLFALFRAIDGTGRRAVWAATVTAASPLFWFTALRPLSDMTGLAVASASQALLAAVIMRRARNPGRAVVVGGLLAGVAIGVRSQTFLLTLPLLGMALALRGASLTAAQRLAAVGAAAVGMVAWTVPLLATSGGLGGYLAALGGQAGEDFSGVVMLWTTRTPRVAVDALVNTALAPWGTPALGALVTLLALAGTLVIARADRRALTVIAAMTVPYAAFHLVFQETVTVRYALPLVVPVAFLAVRALDAAGRTALPIAAGAIIAASLIMTLPAALAYARHGSPTFQMLRDISRDGPHPAGPLAMHAVLRRAVQWSSDQLQGPNLSAAQGREWLALVERWRAEPALALTFAADPRRTDLALVDPNARHLTRSYRWAFSEWPFVAGARPGNVDLYDMQPPGWMLDRGWALTAEIGGVTAREGAGPHRQPSVAWVRRRADGPPLLIGGRHLGREGDSPVHLTLSREGRTLSEWMATPGAFFRLIPLPEGSLDGSEPYVPLEVRAAAADGRSAIPVALEQFDLQSGRVPMVGLLEGWQEPEYNPTTGRAWRWMAERSNLWIRPVGRDVTLTLTGESPLRYYDGAPNVGLSVGARRIASLQPSDDYTWTVVLPADALAAADGRVTIESDNWFSPAQRDGSADQRHLALRIYSIAVR